MAGSRLQDAIEDVHEDGSCGIPAEQVLEGIIDRWVDAKDHESDSVLAQTAAHGDKVNGRHATSKQ